jgi:hypothetical protein
MAARSVAWVTGEAIPGTPFRHMIRSADTGRLLGPVGST